jgi:serine/threonine protein kinase
MEPERWRQLKSIFNRALEVEPARRAAFLNQACVGDDMLRAEVESLLASHDQSAGFLEQPAYEAAAELIDRDSGELLPGSRLGPYTVSKKLGQGGMGVVYLAIDTRLGRPVAIKALAPQYMSDVEHRERLRREARVAATLSHPSIAIVYALEEYEGHLYIVCEYVRGQTLHEELASGPLPPHLILDTAVEVARALVAAHEQGIIHRDLKPENVIRTPEGTLKVLDFGLARFQALRPGGSLLPTRLTKAGVFLGTPAYASPEQLLGIEVNFHTDIFSFGVMLYELASGIHPFAASDSVATIARILEAEPTDLAQLRPIVPPGLAAIVHRCLRKSREQRYASARDLLADLEQIRSEIAEAPQRRSQPNTVLTPPASAPKLHPLWWWQFHQAWIGFTYYGMLYPMWQVKVWTPGRWGPLFFFLCLGSVGIAANLRFYLWFASWFYPEELPELRRRVAPWIRWADVGFISLLLIGSFAIISEHEIIATLLIGVAIATLGAFLLIEPTTTRAAFEAKKRMGR